MPTSLSYSCDSPFFAARSSRCDQDLEKLAEFLRTLTRQMRQFCKDTKTLSKSAEAIGIHMKNGMGAAGGSSLMPVLACFGDIFTEIANSQEILAESLDNSFTTPLERFCNEEVAAVHSLQNQYLSQRENNETIISRYLQSDLANFGRGTTQGHLDMRAHEVVQQTKRFESVRYDYVRKINEMEARKSFEVAESCVAGILSLNTYYHTCMDRLQASKSFIEELRSQQQRDRAAFEVSMRPLDRKKHDINAVLDAMVERVEMASIFLQTDMSSASVPGAAAMDGAPGALPDHSPAAPPESASSNTLSRIGAFMGGFGSSSSKGGHQTGRKSITEDSNTAVQVTALCEECEARMKALDHSELVPFFNVRPDEEPAGAVKQGYLWRRVSRKVMDTWERRWFILDDSKLYYVSESEDSHRINIVCELMLANIRELKSYEVPFCFEVAFANFKTTIVQAEGIKEYAVWILALRNGIEKSLVSGRPSAGPGNAVSNGEGSGNTGGAGFSLQGGGVNSSSAASRRSQMRPVIDRILAGSPLCAECDRPGPEWVSLNLGCLVCIDCSGVHRSMGVHISKMRSLTLDDMEPAEYAMLLQLGNTVTNSIWEKEMKVRSAEKPTAKSNYVTRDKFIRAKYQYKAFLTNPPVCVIDPPGLALTSPPPSSALWDRDVATRALCAAVAENDMYEVVRALAADADVSGGLSISSDAQLKDGMTSPLVLAIRNGSLEAAVLLIINGASLTQEASQTDSCTPLEIAEMMAPQDSEADKDTMSILEQGGTKAICSYILNKVEQGTRLGVGYSPKVARGKAVDSSSRGAEDKNSSNGPGRGKGEGVVAGKQPQSSGNGSLSKKAKQFMSRAASPKVVEISTSPSFDLSNTANSSVPNRYRGASDFGEMAVTSPVRSRSRSNGDIVGEEPVSKSGHATSPVAAASSDAPSSHKKKNSHPTPGGSKISQKMRSAFSSTDFLFPHSNTHNTSEKPPAVPPQEEVFHQPFAAHNGDTGSASSINSSRSSFTDGSSSASSPHKL